MRFTKKSQEFQSLGCGQTHKTHYMGTCEACGSTVFSESCEGAKSCGDSWGDAPDPRGIFGEKHSYAPIRAREQGYSGRDIVLCFDCANDGDKYRAVTESAKSTGSWSKMESGNYHISARRWFDKVNGNTYHSVVVTFPDGTTRLHGMTYGYGEHYLQTALELMNGGEYPKYEKSGNPKPLWTWAEENGVKYVVDCVDVQRRKDLHAS